MVENHFRIAVGYPIEDAIRREPDTDSVRTEHFGHRLDDFDKKPGSVFDRAAVGIRAQIGPVLQELIEEIPAGSKYLRLHQNRQNEPSPRRVGKDEQCQAIRGVPRLGSAEPALVPYFV